MHSCVLYPIQVLTIEPGCYFIDFLLDRALADPALSRYSSVLVFYTRSQYIDSSISLQLQSFVIQLHAMLNNNKIYIFYFYFFLKVEKHYRQLKLTFELLRLF